MTMLDRIKELCDKNNIKIKPLEEKLGLSNGSIRQWDEKYPSCDRIAKVANYFNVSIEYLLTGSDPGIEKYLTKEEICLLKNYNSLDELSKTKVQYFMEVSLKQLLN